MSGPEKSDPGIAGLQNDISSLKRDVASLIDHLRVGATTGAQSAAEHLDDSAHKMCRGVAAEGNRAAELGLSTDRGTTAGRAADRLGHRLCRWAVVVTMSTRRR